MRVKQFSLKFDHSNITVTAGTISQISAHSKTLSFEEETTSANIVLDEGTSLEDFEAKITNSIKTKSKLSYLVFQLKNKIGSLFTVVISLLIIVFITLLAIYQSLSYDLFSGNDSSNIFRFNTTYFYYLLSLIILLFLVISPKIILGEYENLFDWANTRFSAHSRIVRRLERGLLTLHKLNRQNTLLNIWNPMVAGRDNWICAQLLPALVGSALPANIIIRLDEKDAFLEIMKANDLGKYYLAQIPEHETNPEKTFPYHLLSTWEKECMHCLLFSSTKQLPDSWKDNNTKQSIVVSKELGELVHHFYRSNLSSSASGITTFEKFMNRCVDDYGYMKPTADKRTENFVLCETSLIGELDSVLLEKVNDSVLNNLGSISADINDPLAFVILIGLLGVDNVLNTRKINLLSGFIRNVDRVENYQLMSSYWKYISSSEPGVNGDFSLEPMHFMDVQTLTDLSACFVNSGMYDSAFEVYNILESIYPAKIAIEIADLNDSLGKYKEALETLLKTDEKWFRSGIVQDMSLKLKLYLNISWVIVSGRFEDRKKEGYQYLEKTETILRKLPDTENHLLFLTQLYNTTANYHEWEENYTLAIENYEKALKLPGTILRKSSLLSNRGISERLIAKKSDDIALKRMHLLTSCSNLRQAVSMKISIGEKNQIPGASHNLSETLLELASITKDKTERVKVLKEANNVASHALDILDELNSQKRRGRLLTEKYIAHFMLGVQGEPSEEKTIKESLDLWLQKEEKDSYDYREITRLLDQFIVTEIS
jgi:tetratricopeptide (TPR) repeat protein